LRLLIAQRIERIDQIWSATILGADKFGMPEKPYAVATVRFRNGASQMVVFPTRESARVLKLGQKDNAITGRVAWNNWGYGTRFEEPISPYPQNGLR